MGINKVLKLSFTLLVFGIVSLLVPVTVWGASYSLNPNAGGTVDEGDTFFMDVLIDSEGEDVSQARAVLTFDPTKLEVKQASRNNSLFASFPDEQQTIDNDNGVIMLTGFTQSGNEKPLYNTSGEPDVYFRIEFEAIRDGDVTIDWEYSGSDEDFKSVIVADGSPPTNVLGAKPSSVDITINDTDSTSPGGNDGGNNGGFVPKTSVFDNTSLVVAIVVILGSVSMFVGTGVLYRSGVRFLQRKNRTIIEYEEDDE